MPVTSSCVMKAFLLAVHAAQLQQRCRLRHNQRHFSPMLRAVTQPPPRLYWLTVSPSKAVWRADANSAYPGSAGTKGSMCCLMTPGFVIHISLQIKLKTQPSCALHVGWVQLGQVRAEPLKTASFFLRQQYLWLKWFFPLHRRQCTII